jgi:hypothetical protein
VDSGDEVSDDVNNSNNNIWFGYMCSNKDIAE